MTIEYKIMPFRFNGELWAQTLKTIRNPDLDEFAEIIGIDESTLRNWRNQAHRGDFAHPSMSNFLKACNWLDVDPREYLTL